jgi:trehalose 6-phosphate phosphatase
VVPWDKGYAVKLIMENATNPRAFPIYIGDDTTDEDAFKFIRDCGGITIVVSEKKKETAAEYVVKNPSEVRQVLELLHEAATAEPSTIC